MDKILGLAILLPAIGVTLALARRLRILIPNAAGLLRLVR